MDRFKSLVFIVTISPLQLYGDELVNPVNNDEFVESLPVFSPVLGEAIAKGVEEENRKIKDVVAKVLDGTDLDETAQNLAEHGDKVNLDAKIKSLEIDENSNKNIHPLDFSNFLKNVYNDSSLINNKISLKVHNVSLEDVVVLLNKVLPINFVLDSDATGLVKHFSVDNLSASAIVATLLSQNNPELALLSEFGVYRIVKLSKIQEKFNSIASCKEDDFVSKFIIIQNQKLTENFKMRVEKMWQGLLSGSGFAKGCYLVCDETSKKIFFRGPKPQIDSFSKYLEEVDVEIPQVKIEARVVIAHKNFEESFGLQWSNVFNHRAGIKRGVGFVGSGPLDAISNHPTPQSRGSLMDWALNLFPIIGEANRQLHLPFVFGGNDLNTKRLNVVLNAAENHDELKTILKPCLVTNHAEEAEILVGELVPIEVIVKETIEGSLRDITTVNYKDVGIKLKVRPYVAPDTQTIFLDIYVENSFRLNRDKFPVIETSNSRSRVLLKSGQTTLIGGLLKNEQNSQKNALPFISKIPLLGLLFQGSRKFIEDKQLLIFITPTVM